MNTQSIRRREEARENKYRLKSGIITAVIWSAILAFLFLYKVTERIPEKQEVVTRMLINFGDNQNGNGAEEPANQDGSVATETPAPTPETASPEKAEPAPEPVKKAVKEKIITGNNANTAAPKNDKTTPKETKAKTSVKTVSTKSSSQKTAIPKTATTNAKTVSGDGKGTAAIGNLLKGRGTKAVTQGTNGTNGNAGDPLGGDGNGDSKIGVDRKLTGYIPGTMGRGGAQPSHNCTASGTISISYTVDKAGNVVSARRSGGISDPCVVSTSVSWVKRYVKAEKASTSSTGTYRITF